MEILLIVMAVILFLGMIADEDKDAKRNYSICFMVVIIATVALRIVG